MASRAPPRSRPLLCTLLCICLGVAGAHPDGAGSCGSPWIGHGRSLSQSPDGGYTCEALDAEGRWLARPSPGQEIFVRVRGFLEPLEGFQIVANGNGTFHDLPQGTKFNTEHCDEPGRVTHTDRNNKKEVMVPFKVSEQATFVNFTCYVVKDFEHWYELYSGHLATEANDSVSDVPKYCSQGSPLDGYDCVQQLSQYFALHWRIGGKAVGPQALSDTRQPLSNGEIAFAMRGLTPGWVGMAFARAEGRMAPADGVVGWLSEGLPNVKPYIIQHKNLHLGDEDPTIALHNISATEENGYTTIEFTRIMQAGRVRICPTKTMFVNFAIGREDGLTNHHHRGRGWVRITFDLEGPSHEYYHDLHGLLMVIAWIGVLPLAMVTARHKWALVSLGPTGWFHLHHLIVLIAMALMLASLLVATLNFDVPYTVPGQLHKYAGIVVSVLLMVQVTLGITRPAPHHRFRWVFELCHHWLGRTLVTSGVVMAYLGANALNALLDEDVTGWVVAITCLVILHLGVNVVAEVRKHQQERKGQWSEIRLTTLVSANMAYTPVE
ncbi:unnamed protein product [Ostreobium quekettii]|uniref:Ferric-chelate reductase 1 n=1 Tax=Ostreobium quekettii TaxID=121088 RepID=A0A8S1IN67_9CHLO|nr:unnamed protein product [Ostreobium quekettii]